MLLWLLATAWAQDAPSYPRFDAPLTVRPASRVIGEGPARLYGRRGALRAWVFPDGHVEHYVRTERGQRTELVRFDGRLAHHLTVRYEDDAPVEVLVRGQPDQTVDVSGWVPAELDAASLRVPPSVVTDGVLTAGGFSATWLPGHDVVSAGFVEAIEAQVGGRVLATATAWIDRSPSVRLTLSLPDPDAPEVAEAWAVPRGEQLFLATWRAPKGEAPLSIDTLAEGRAIMALVSWQDDP